MPMVKKRASLKLGFTIVELLIVIVVIAILAAISIVAYNGIQQRAANSQSLSVMNQWVKAFEVYRANTGDIPVIASGDKYCLGTGFPGSPGKCRAYQATGANTYNEADNAALMAMFTAQNISIPGIGKAVGAQVGPFVIAATAVQYQIWIPLYGSSSAVCTNNGLTLGSDQTASSGYAYCYSILKRS
jgi:prepilin-type N-terminal cleavage/methylation domain-containing protein